jgi:hypothetical protein
MRLQRLVLTAAQIWQIADTDNRGFLGPSGFGVVLRLIGHAQGGRPPTAQLATQRKLLPIPFILWASVPDVFSF